MNKKRIIVGIITISIIVMGIGFYFTKNKRTLDEVIEINQAMEIYEQLGESQVDTITINLQNEHVLVSKSDNRFIKIVSKPSNTGVNFHFYLKDGKLNFTVGKEQTDACIIPTDAQLIYVYLPANCDIDMSITTDTGFVDVSGVTLKNLNIKTRTGIVSLTDIVVDSYSVDNDAKIYKRNIEVRKKEE